MKPRIEMVIGKTGSGKTFWNNAHLWEFDRVIIYDPLEEYEGRLFFDMDEMIDHIENNLLYRVRYNDFEQFQNLCKLVYQLGDCVFCVEESQRIFTSHVLPEEFKDLIYRGRHEEIGLIIVSQRASSINIAVRSQFTRCVTFRQTEPNDIQWLYELCGDEEIYKVANLEDYHYIDITPKGLKFCDPI